MKSIKKLLMLLVVLTIALTTACKKEKDPEPDPKKQFEVQFVSGSTIHTETVNEGELVSKYAMDIPFCKVIWMYEGKEFDFNTPITKNISLDAKLEAGFHIDGKTELQDGKATTLTVKDDEGHRPSVTWTNSNSDVVSILSERKDNIRIEGLKPGTSEITATLKDNPSISTSVTVTVSGATFSIEYDLNEEDLPLLPKDAVKSFDSSKLPVTLPLLEKEHWIFLGWSLNGDGKPVKELTYGDDTKMDLTLTPMWTYPHIDVTLSDDSSIIKVNEEKQVTIANTSIPEELWEKGVNWSSANNNVSISDTGVITGLNPGQATITCSLKVDPSIMITLGLTVVEEATTVSQVMQDLLARQNAVITPRSLPVYTWQLTYKTTMYYSVSDFLFEDLKITENIAPVGNHNRPGDIYEKKYICVHDTADNAYGAEQWSNVVHAGQYPNGDYYEASFQYVVDELGVYHNIPDNERAFHAGDGHTKYFMNPTGIKATYPNPDKHPKITIGNDGFFYLNGKKTTVLTPRKPDGSLVTEENNNEMGIRTEIRNGEYYLGDTWFSKNSFNHVANCGGNVNSIGIETCIQQGTDLYLTYQHLAKLVAKLLDENNLTIDDVVGHHFFSGKPCPQTLMRNGLWDYFKDLVSFELKMRLYQKEGYKISMVSNDHEFLGDNGRIIKNPRYSKNVSYTITVEKDGVKESMTCHSLIQGTACIE